MTTYTRGDTRRDGYRFWAYEKKRGRIYETWRSPDAYNRMVEVTKSAWRKWKQKQKAARE